MDRRPIYREVNRIHTAVGTTHNEEIDVSDLNELSQVMEGKKRLMIEGTKDILKSSASCYELGALTIALNKGLEIVHLEEGVSYKKLLASNFGVPERVFDLMWAFQYANHILNYSNKFLNLFIENFRNDASCDRLSDYIMKVNVGKNKKMAPFDKLINRLHWDNTNYYSGFPKANDQIDIDRAALDFFKITGNLYLKKGSFFSQSLTMIGLYFMSYLYEIRDDEMTKSVYYQLAGEKMYWEEKPSVFVVGKLHLPYLCGFLERTVKEKKIHAFFSDQNLRNDYFFNLSKYFDVKLEFKREKAYDAIKSIKRELRIA